MTEIHGLVAEDGVDFSLNLGVAFGVFDELVE